MVVNFFIDFLLLQDLQQDVESAHAVINQLEERERRQQTDYDSKACPNLLKIIQCTVV
jgi:hypothetical protein